MSQLTWKSKNQQRPAVLLAGIGEDLRVGMEDFLRQSNRTMHCAASFSEALTALDNYALDLALIDIDQDHSLALLQELQKRFPCTPVVTLTSRPSPHAAAAFRYWAFDCLVKPLEMQHILLAVSRALKHKALLDEKQRLEQELSDVQRKYRLLAENAEDLVWTLGPDLRVEYSSPAAFAIFGYEAEEVLGMSPEDFVLKEDAGHDAAWRTWLASLHKGPVPPLTRVWQLRAVAKNNNVLWTDSTTTALYDEERFLGVLIVTREITDKKRTELALSRAMQEKERYRRNMEATFRSIPDAIITMDNEMRLIAVNAAAEHICGLGPAIVPGEPFQLQAPCGSTSCLDVVHTTLRTKAPVRSLIVSCSRPGLPQRHVELNCTPLLDDEDRHTGAVLVVKDVTRLLDLEKRLDERKQFRNIVGKSKHMQAIYQLIEQLANVDSTVLIQGETGTGKELVAEALHYGGVRANAPLIKVNCSALSESLLESELFGHVRGAFTGAIRDKEGRIQAAGGGTLFLDEIGDISPLLQLKLLRFLEQKEFERVGESNTRKADVRVITASNVDLLEKVNQGRFRQDLYYRLNVMVINVPSLRERTEDIPLFVEHFLAHFGGVFHKNFSGITKDALSVLMHYPWPGNVRELKHCLEHACILCQHGPIGVHHLPREVLTRKRLPSRAIQAFHGGRQHDLGRQDILEALEQAEGNKAKAARMLGIDRTTLYRKMARHQIDV